MNFIKYNSLNFSCFPSTKNSRSPIKSIYIIIYALFSDAAKVVASFMSMRVTLNGLWVIPHKSFDISFFFYEAFKRQGSFSRSLGHLLITLDRREGKSILT